MVDCMWTTGLHVGSRGAQEIEHHQEFIGSLLQIDCGFGPDGCESCVKRVSNSHMWLERKANVDVVRAKLS